VAASSIARSVKLVILPEFERSGMSVKFFKMGGSAIGKAYSKSTLPRYPRYAGSQTYARMTAALGS
jgi:hypothetical protein